MILVMNEAVLDELIGARDVVGADETAPERTIQARVFVPVPEHRVHRSAPRLEERYDVGGATRTQFVKEASDDVACHARSSTASFREAAGVPSAMLMGASGRPVTRQGYSRSH